MRVFKAAYQYSTCVVSVVPFLSNLLICTVMLPLSSCPMLHWDQRGDRHLDFLSVCVSALTVCLEDSVWKASSRLQCDICFSLHLSETHTLPAHLMHVCVQVCVCAFYAGGSLVEQLMLVISVVNSSPRALHWPLGRTFSLQCLCTDKHAWKRRQSNT